MELSCYCTLAHQDSFDVRWIKNGTVADSLISPLANTLIDDYSSSLQALGGIFVKTMSIDEIDDDNMNMKASKISCTTAIPHNLGLVLQAQQYQQ